jgi:NADH-quinone oxidoreductase subunit A
MITAMLFIVFDIEIIFLYPWAVSFAPLTNDAGSVISSGLGVFALVEMLLFIATVLAAYAYVWRRKGLDWD